MLQRQPEPRWVPLRELVSYLRIDPTFIQLIYNDDTYRIIPFAQHLYEQEINRELMPHEFVSHIDSNLENYKLENLRLYICHPEWPNVLDKPVPATKREVKRAHSYFSKRDGRYYTDIYDYKLDRIRKTTARYNMEQTLGRDLLPSEDTDHIDNNRLNDNINNLQVLSHRMNVEKAALQRGYRVGDDMYGSYTCGLCDKLFSRIKNKADKERLTIAAVSVLVKLTRQNSIQVELL